ncbi:MAG: hypothetical protein JWM85_1160 [Acidimicrobiaceae bacterium]|nr:hypothetical protein [Acidimicrobiaceae bacterium]
MTTKRVAPEHAESPQATERSDEDEPSLGSELEPDTPALHAGTGAEPPLQGDEMSELTRGTTGGGEAPSAPLPGDSAEDGTWLAEDDGDWAATGLELEGELEAPTAAGARTEEVGPEELGPDELGPEELAPEELAPEELAPEQWAPELDTGDQTPSERVSGTVVGPPLAEQDVAELDQLAQDEREGLPLEDELVPLPDPYVQVRFVDVVMVLPSMSPVVILEELDWPSRQLRIPIGAPEGVAIGYASRGIRTPKPLTHELMIDLLEAFSLTIDAVRITGVSGASFTAELTCSGPSGSRTLPCRPSDGIALCLRQTLWPPLLVAPEVLDQLGVGEDGTTG